MTNIPLDLMPKPAVREKQKLSISLVGGASAGKTASALILAKGLLKGMYPDLDTNSKEFWSKVWLADTESGRSKAYANGVIPNTSEYVGSFMHIDFNPPYSVERVIAMMDYAKENGCEIFILDSYSSTWEGEGGEIEVHQELGGGFQHWNLIKPIEGKLYDYVFHNPKMHIITCIRAKTSYSMETTATGKTEVVKLGLQPIARDNFEYEPWVTLHLNMNHMFKATNDKTGIFTNPDVLSCDYGTLLYEWAEVGVEPEKVDKTKVIDHLGVIAKEEPEVFKLVSNPFISKMKARYNTVKLAELPISELLSFEKELMKRIPEEDEIIMNPKLDITEPSEIVEVSKDGVAKTTKPKKELKVKVQKEEEESKKNFF